jgi:hypothetical protein
MASQLEDILNKLLAHSLQPVGDLQNLVAEVSKILQFSLWYHRGTNRTSKQISASESLSKYSKRSDTTLTANRDGDLVKSLSYGLLPLGLLLISTSQCFF